MEVTSADKYEGAFKEAVKMRSAAVAVTQDPLTILNQKQIADLGRKITCRRYSLAEILSRTVD
jgi:hypothetical protein